MIFRASAGIRGKLWDLDTGKVIPRVVWFDDATGTFEAYRVDGNGDIRCDPEDGAPLVWLGRGNLKFIQEPTATLVSTPRLPEGCWEQGQKVVTRVKHERLSVPLLDADCEHYACLLPAEYSVGDEIPMPPVFSKGKWWGRGRMVNVRYYCAKHYEPPRIVDARGEVVSVCEEAGGVRPQ